MKIRPFIKPAVLFVLGIAYPIVVNELLKQPAVDFFGPSKAFNFFFLYIVTLLPTMVLITSAVKLAESVRKNAATPQSRDFWAGTLTLGRTFWAYFCPITIVALLCGRYALIQWAGSPQLSTRLLLLFVLFVLFAYQMLAVMGTWRSAKHFTGNPIWRLWTKSAVGIVAASTWALIFFYPWQR